VNAMGSRTPVGFDSRSARGAGSTVVLAAMLGLVGGVPIAVAVGVPVVAAILTLWLRGRAGPLAPEYGLLPVLGAVGVIAVWAHPSLLVGALAGSTGLALLLWGAETPRESLRGPDPFGGLALPGLCVAVALLAAFALPAAQADVGAAAVAIVAAFGLLAWAFVESARERSVPAQTL
jgi:Flp pilus assembly pilin Flp